MFTHRYTFAPEGLHYVLHSYDNQPAHVKANGYRAWYDMGVRQRVIYANGVEKLYEQGELVRIIWPDGATVYLKSGKFHNDNGPAIVSHNGTCYWFLRGRRLSLEEYMARPRKKD